MIHRCRRMVLLLMCFTTAVVATSMSPGELIELGVTRLTKQMLTQRAMLELDTEKPTHWLTENLARIWR